MHLLGWRKKMELKWLVIGFIAGTALGYAQGSGMVDIISLLPI